MVALAARLRLDELLVQRGLAASRQHARALVLAGRVTVAGRSHVKPGLALAPDAAVTVAAAPSYVSRGGTKLAHALDRFRIRTDGAICADIGASTGGFTDCLLQHGAVRVYAIDVGRGQLDWRLRTDPRVVVLERTNARYLERLPEPVGLVAVDASFISARLLLPAVQRITLVDADVIVLIKPQFEAGRGKVSRGGVVRDPVIHEGVLREAVTWVRDGGYELCGLTVSPLRGPAGNVEFLAHLRAGSGNAAHADALVGSALAEARELR